MAHVGRYAFFVVLLVLTGCTAAGLGSLAMEGLQLVAGGTQPSTPSGNTAPFAAQDHSQAIEALNDALSRTISEACTADVGKDSSATPAMSRAPIATAADSRVTAAPAAGPERQCGYRPICLPGRSSPLVMLVCDGGQGASDTAGASDSPGSAKPQSAFPARAAAD